MLGEQAFAELDLLPFEKFFRAYIGFHWFYATEASRSATEMCAKLQDGVDRTIEATPVLSGVLKEDGERVYVSYNKDTKVKVQLIRLSHTYKEISKRRFDQNAFKQLFMDQQMLLSAMPGITNVPVLQVQLFWLQDNHWAVGVLCHHVLADAFATLQVAQSITNASRGLDPLCLDADRNVVKGALLAQAPHVIPTIKHVRETFNGNQNNGILDQVPRSQTRRRQIHIARDAISRLKSLPPVPNHYYSTNSLVMALMWRAWTRMLVCRGSKSEHTYMGWPIDMRSHVPSTSRYLGNLFLPYMGHATKHFVLDCPLSQVAQHVAQLTKGASVAQLRAFEDSVREGEPDVRGILEQSDSPALSFSNMTQLQLHEDINVAGIGNSAASVQMLAIDAPMMMFAINDGAGGMLINVVLPDHIASALAADAEFADYAELVY
ncbi:hypothetical protein IW140_006011 [Coemansia sp. RSA 1813]|nr:hypothetical protein EV178_003359 [Coemansia sp. RSA 1646]KAJ1774123.1 hypothetical protein LPJ74_000222 [Coemansia sp. RSA 1843]KAJ2086015.1 hypothetical protein IW138_005971 [Coemansia sp. RSA 986]KAJ2563694.1 hypothetical protein IW140_006011 [Coemansia sp. RSA 1813]